MGGTMIQVLLVLAGALAVGLPLLRRLASERAASSARIDRAEERIAQLTGSELRLSGQLAHLERLLVEKGLLEEEEVERKRAPVRQEPTGPSGLH